MSITNDPLPIFTRFEKEARAFLACYVEVKEPRSDDNSSIHMNYPPKMILSIFAQYMLTGYTPDGWLDSVMILSGQEDPIEFRYFRGTPYEGRVGTFLSAIYSSFYKCDLTDKVNAFLDSEDSPFTLPGEKEICKTFYEKLMTMNRFHLYHSFGINPSPREKKDMEEVSTEYNEYIKRSASDPEHVRVLGRFDTILKQLATTNRIQEIKF